MTTKKNEILVGAHMSIADGIEKSILRGEAIGCTAIQIFTKSNRSYSAPPLKQEDIKLFRETLKKSPVQLVMAHTSYLINIGASDASIEKKSVNALIHELERCEQLGIPYLVLHPGSHTGAGEEKCIHQIAKNLEKIFDKVPGDTMILLETAAGQGTNIGYTFEQIKSIIEQCNEKKRLGVCFDTCHVFSSGYDISTPAGYKHIMDKFLDVIGINKLKAIHLNDSKTECGSKKDRHENLGKGTIPMETFKLIMNDPHLVDIPKVLETPLEEEYEQEVKILKGMVNE